MEGLYYCPGCGHPVDLPTPVELLYDRKQVEQLVPCSRDWLKNRQMEPWLHEPIYMLNKRRTRIRMFTATDVRRLRIARFAEHDRRTNKEELPF